MKTFTATALLFLGLASIAGSLSVASETKNSDPATGGGQVVHGEQAMGHAGAVIHKSEIDGYRLSYELIDMKGKMPDMPEMAATHHLMVYVKDAEGTAVEDAKAGFLIEGPDGQVQKVMCMGMGGGYGADVDLKKNGPYAVKTKIVTGKKKLMDSFIHETGS